MESVIFIKKYSDLFAESQNKHYHDTRFKDHLRTNISHQTITLNSPYNYIIRIYNKMPLEIKNETKINLLKKHVKIYLKSRNLYSINEII